MAFELKGIEASNKQFEGVIIEISKGEVAFEEEVLDGVEGEGGIRLSSAEEESFGGLGVDEEFVLLEFEVELDGAGVLESRVCGGVRFGGGGLHGD